MPHQRLAHEARLAFSPGSLVHTNLSGAAISSEGNDHWLWDARDEACGVDRPRGLLGLRGPVLHGWSCLQELAVQARGDDV